MRAIKKTTQIGLLLTVVLSSLMTGGCFYDHEAVKAFLQQPRSPVSGLEYRIYPPDEILITSLYVAEIHNSRIIVRPDGTITLPLLGEVQVAGHTPKELEELLADAAREYYDKVAADVEIVGYNSQRFYVFGHVEHPGPLPWTGRDTLLDALAKAVPTARAWPERILVVRGDDPQVGGQYRVEAGERGSYEWWGVRPELRDRPRKKLVVNMMAMLEAGDLSNNVLLLPEDVIYVQPNPLARAAIFMESIYDVVYPGSESIQSVRYAYDDLRYFDQTSWNDPAPGVTSR